MLGTILESAGVLLTIATPLVAVPLTVITFYLRSLREHQISWHAELMRRVEIVEGAAVELRKTVTAFERDYTNKEEWLRECMLARRTLEHLTEKAVRMETTMQEATWTKDHRASRASDRKDTPPAPAAGSEGKA